MIYNGLIMNIQDTDNNLMHLAYDYISDVMQWEKIDISLSGSMYFRGVVNCEEIRIRIADHYHEAIYQDSNDIDIRIDDIKKYKYEVELEDNETEVRYMMDNYIEHIMEMILNELGQI